MSLKNNSRMQGPFIVGGEIFAAGTTVYKTVPGSAATARSSSGILTGQTSVRSFGGMSSAGTITAGGAISGSSVTSSGGFTMVQGNQKRFSFGTYIGTGGATAAITSSGLTRVDDVILTKFPTFYSTATTGNVLPRPCRANGTQGSFYPILFKHTGTTAIWALNTVAGTHRWLVLGV